MGVSLKNIVHDTTISAADANGKTIGAGVTLTGLITPQTALMLTQLHTSEAVRDAYQRRSGANDNSAAMAIASPVASLVDNAQSQLESARDQVKSAEDAVKSAQESAKQNAQTQAMANATKSEPQLDPYLSRNASVYYGTATEQFYKEISWQDASLNAANESLSTDQEALNDGSATAFHGPGSLQHGAGSVQSTPVDCGVR
jgi:Mg2+ and Co2+ transporter CorA